MSTSNTKIEFDQEKFERWVTQVSDATISDEDMEMLMRMCAIESATFEVASDKALQRRLRAAVNSYCHIIRIAREYQDVDVDPATARALLAKRRRYEPLSDDEISLLGKRSSDPQSDEELYRAFGSEATSNSGPFQVSAVLFYDVLTDNQFAILAESLFQQAVVHGTGSVTDKCWFAEGVSECPNVARKLVIARGISLVTEGLDWALRYSKLSPEEKAEHDKAMAMFNRAIHGLPLEPQNGELGAD